MLGKLALTRTNLVALATLLALVAAMVVSLGPARAADPAIGDVSHSYGFCAFTQAERVADPDNSDPALRPALSAEWTLVTARDVTPTVATDGTEVTVLGPDGDDADEALDPQDIHCTEDDVNKPFTITPDGTTTPNVDEAEPVALLFLGDQDGTVEGGDELVVNLYLANWNTADSVADLYGTGVFGTDDSTLDLSWVQVAGPTIVEDGEDTEKPNLSFLPGAFATRGIGWNAAIYSKTLAKGIPSGEYTVSARIVWDTDDLDSTHDGDGDGSADSDGKGTSCAEGDLTEADPPACAHNMAAVPNDDEVMEISATFMVGDAGDDVGSVVLALGNEKEDNPLTTALETKAETGTAPADGGDIWVRMNSLTSLGGPTNPGDIKSITFIAPGADLTVYDDGGFSGGRLVDADGELRKAATLAGFNIAEGDPDDGGSGNNSVQVNSDELEHTMWVRVEKEDDEPGTVDIYAIVVGDGSSKSSDTLTLTFGGDAKTLELGEPASVAVGKKTEFSISAVDDAGNEAEVEQVAFSVVDADGKPVPGTKIEVTQGNTGDSTVSVADDDEDEVAGIVSVGAKAEAGVYTVNVRVVGAASVKGSVEVVVGGSADSIELAADPETGDATEQTLITVTATVTDKNDALVVDGTRVEFTALGANIAAIGPGHSPIETQIQKQLVNTADPADEPEYEERTLTTTVGGATTKDGEVSVTFVVVGSGTATVNATAEGGKASGNLRITTTDSSVEEAEAMPAPEASLDCLSELSGFSAWTCEVDSSASEIFEMLSGRGASAILLWNGSDWVRYSVVEGQTIPGSSDFSVTDNDILFISN